MSDKGRVIAFLNPPVKISVLLTLISSDYADGFVLDVDDAENIVIREA